MLYVVCLFIACSWGALLAQGAEPEPEDRVAGARARVEPGLRELCRAAEVPYPPKALFLRALKQESELEVWARAKDQPFGLLMTLPILKRSGQPGPKRKEGDLQVPEGFYAIDLFNPKSGFHLSMRINYPNAADRVLSDPEAPGFDIYVHGSNCSVGCLPLGDANIERLYILALDTRDAGQKEIPIHLFPARMSGEAWEVLRKEHTEKDPKLTAFWQSLQAGYDEFEQTRSVPKITVTADGSYRVAK